MSTDKQDEYSPQAQRRLILDYCKKNNILISNDDFFEDIGISASKQLDRPQFNRMIALCKSKEHQYDKIIVWKFSRFARNQEEAIVYKRMLRKASVDVVSVSEPIPDGMMGDLVERILEWMDEYYSINLSQEVTRGMSEKARAGGIQSRVPYGYSFDKNTKQVSIIKNEADVVKYVFTQYLNGKGYATITNEINEMGFRTRSDRKWDKSSIRQMLGNPFYCGIIRWNARTYKNGTVEHNPQKEWIESEGKHEAIITKESFQKAQDILYTKAKQSKRAGQRDVTARKHWLSGTLKCEKCGSSMNFRNQTNGHKGNPYFYCRGHANHICDFTQQTTAPIIEDMFFKGLEDSIGNIDITKIPTKQMEIPTVDYEQKLKDLKKKEDRIKEAYINGIDTLEEYKENKSIIQSEREKILSLIENTSHNTLKNTSNEEYKDRLTTLHEVLKNPNLSVVEKSETLKQFIEKVSYDKASRHMAFYFKGL